MNRNSNPVVLLRLLIVCVGMISLGFWGCDGGMTVAPESSAARPEGGLSQGTADGSISGTQHSMHGMGMTTDVITLDLDPFTFRAPLDPFVINQPPDFMIHSRATKDIVIQRSVFVPGAGPWHTHPGPSFVYVIQGEIKLEKFTTKDGCTETPVFVPGSAYFEVADEVHRAVVVSAESVVLLVTRFNIPVGGPVTIPAADPGC
jgi:quercetin dioxygenase-like cupin family protein